MGRRGKGEGQRTIGRSEKRGRGWGGLRVFCLSMWVRFCSEEEQKEEQRKKRKKKKWRVTDGRGKENLT